MTWSTVLLIAELIGTAAFALSGAMAGIDRKLDIFGVLVLAACTALGGGTIRDVLLGHFPPRMFYSFTYLGVVAVVAIALFILRVKMIPGKIENESLNSRLFVICDAVGLGIFSVVGTEACLTAGYGDNIFMAVFLGVITGVGGGILRDVMCVQIPGVLRKHIYAVASMAGSLCYYIMRQILLTDPVFATIFCTALVTLLRTMAAHFRWNLPRPE